MVEGIGKAVGITEESKNFNNVANSHFNKGLVSLFICFLLGILTIIWALGVLGISQNMECSNYISSNLYLCQLVTLSKQFLVGAVLLTGIYASLRAYFANANSEAINRHRYNALQAYKDFYKIVEGNDKSLVLQKATEAIFEHIPTGFTKYHKEESKSSDNSAQLTPLIAASLAATNKAVTPEVVVVQVLHLLNKLLSIFLRLCSRACKEAHANKARKRIATQRLHAPRIVNHL